MIEGPLAICQAADKILDIKMENRAVSENRRLTRQEVLVATSLDEDLFEAAYEHFRKSGYLMIPISEEEVWVTSKGSQYHSSQRLQDFLAVQSK